MATGTAPRTPASTRPRKGARRRGRRVLAALGVVVLLLAVLLGAVGWYFAGQIDGEALAVQPPGSPAYDLVVDSAGAGRVTLHRSAAEASDPLVTADRYGLLWPGGSGIVSGPPVPAGSGVTRALQVVSGTAPAPGTPATLDRDVWTDPAQATGVAARNVTYPCAGGSCPAWFLPGTSSTWLVAVHGKGASRTEPLRAIVPAVRAGLPVLDIAYRNDPGAPADPSGRYGYGTTEWHDLDQAVRYATAHGAQHVILFGSSMGGAIVASYLEHARPATVRGIVLDAPALDLRSAVELGAAQRRLPVVGTPLPGVLTATAEWIAGWRYGVDWAAMDYLRADWLHVPALVFHGTADATVPISTSDRLRAEHPDLVREVRVPGAPHVGSWNVDPAAYTATESAFLGCLAGTAPAVTCAAG